MTIKPLVPLFAIVAMAKNRTIGKNNQLPWHLPADLKHFKALTIDNTVIMGRKTFSAIGKPLPQRTNIIITRDTSFKAPGCIVVASLQAAFIEAAKTQTKKTFIIGGGDIYAQTMPYLNGIYLTIVEQEFAGDTFFPRLNMQEWKEVSREYHTADAKNPYAYSFIELVRV